MGTRWEGAVTRGRNGDLELLARELLRRAPEVRPGIQLTFSALEHPSAAGVWLLELSGVNRRPLQAAADQSPDAEMPPAALQVWRTSASAILAVAASRVFGDAVWVFHSDSLSQSGSVRLSAGRVVGVEWADDQAREADRSRAVSLGLDPYLPEIADVDELLDRYYGENAACRSWRLMDRRVVLPEPMVLEPRGRRTRG